MTLQSTSVLSGNLGNFCIIKFLACFVLAVVATDSFATDRNSDLLWHAQSQGFSKDNMGPIGWNLSQALRERADMVWLAESYRVNGLAEEYLYYYAKVKELDQKIYILQGKQAMIDLSFGYVDRLQQLWSAATGRTIRLVQTSQAEYRVFADDRMFKDGLSLVELSKLAEQALGLR